MKLRILISGLAGLLLAGQVLAGTGGPDEEGYRWIDSDTTGGPVYNWIDITVIGSLITDWVQVDPGYQPEDEGYVKRALGFSFPFYGSSYDTVYIHTNGHLGFELEDANLVTWGNRPIPDTLRPNGTIYPFWDDLGYPTDGDAPNPGVYFWTNGIDTAVVEYHQYDHAGMAVWETFEVVLLSNGEMYCQYETVMYQSTNTVGLESPGGTTGLEYLYFRSPEYDTLHAGLCIKFYHQDFMNEVAVVSIDSIGELVEPDSLTVPWATVKNRAVNPATFDVRCIIYDTLNSEVYGDTQTVTNLLPDASYGVQFGPWPVGEAGNRYRVFVETMLLGDEYPANDTLSLQTVAFHEVRVINSPYTFIIPTFDGSIDTVNEWGDAVRVDISNVLGRGGTGGASANSTIMYAKNDSTHLYVATDCVIDNALNENDAGEFYVDDDHDGVWIDSTEGWYLERNRGAGDTILFRPSTGGWSAVPGASVRVESTSGNVQHEFSIPIGGNFYELNAGLGDTMGLHYNIWEAGSGTIQGWWPQTSGAGGSIFGDIVLGIGPGVQERKPEARRRRQEVRLWQNYPNPSGGHTVICYQLPVDSRVVLTVYDAAGRVIRNVVDEQESAGYHAVVWDGRTDTERRVSKGVYFCRMQVGDFAAIKKLVLLH